MVSSAGLAHVWSLPNKITMPAQDYLMVQQVYRGWALLSIVIVCAIISTTVQSVVYRRARKVFILSVGALCCLILSQIIFWMFTFPANQQTLNWTYLPDSWRQLRDQWEYSHAAGCFFGVVAFILVILSALQKKRNNK